MCPSPEDDSARARRASVVHDHLQFHRITFPKVSGLVRVQLHESTSVRTLQIPNTGSRTIVSTHEKILHTLVRLGNPALAVFVPNPVKPTRISRMGQ